MTQFSLKHFNNINVIKRKTFLMDFLELFLFYTFEKLIQSDEQNNLMNDIY